MKITIGNFLDKGLDNGTIKPSQIVVYYDYNNNLKWLGKAEFAPIFLDWAALDHYEYVENELRVWEEKRPY